MSETRQENPQWSADSQFIVPLQEIECIRSIINSSRNEIARIARDKPRSFRTLVNDTILDSLWAHLEQLHKALPRNAPAYPPRRPDVPSLEAALDELQIAEYWLRNVELRHAEHYPQSPAERIRSLIECKRLVWIMTHGHKENDPHYKGDLDSVLGEWEKHMAALGDHGVSLELREDPPKSRTDRIYGVLLARLAPHLPTLSTRIGRAVELIDLSIRGLRVIQSVSNQPPGKPRSDIEVEGGWKPRTQAAKWLEREAPWLFRSLEEQSFDTTELRTVLNHLSLAPSHIGRGEFAEPLWPAVRAKLVRFAELPLDSKAIRTAVEAGYDDAMSSPSLRKSVPIPEGKASVVLREATAEETEGRPEPIRGRYVWVREQDAIDGAALLYGLHRTIPDEPSIWLEWETASGELVHHPIDNRGLLSGPIRHADWLPSGWEMNVFPSGLTWEHLRGWFDYTLNMADFRNRGDIPKGSEDSPSYAPTPRRLVSHAYLIVRRLDLPQSPVEPRTPMDREGCIAELRDLAKFLESALSKAPEPSADESEKSEGKKRRGRKTERDTIADERIAEAWAAGRYHFKTHENMARELKTIIGGNGKPIVLTKRVVGLAIENHQAAQRRKAKA